MTICLGIILSTDRDWATEHLPAGRVQDLGDVALLPGLVNAHTHLEFSNLASPLGKPGMSLPSWIGEVLAARAERSNSAMAIAMGVAESLAAGVTTIGEIASEAWPEPACAALPRVTVFRELIGLSGERVGAALSAAAMHLAGRDRVVLSGAGRPLRPICPHVLSIPPPSARSDVDDRVGK